MTQYKVPNQVGRFMLVLPFSIRKRYSKVILPPPHILGDQRRIGLA